MIRSLRRRFIGIAMLSLLGTMAVLCTAIGVGNYFAAARRADRAISMLYQNGGAFLQPFAVYDPSSFEFQITPETSFEMRYAIVELTARQKIRAVNIEHIAALDMRAVAESIGRIISSGTDHGYEDYYRYRVFQNEDGGSTIIVLDCFQQLQASNSMIRIMLVVSFFCVIIVFALLLVFSKKAIRPFVENAERQRRFITDASHELKTPLSILSADMGLLEDVCGDSKWLKSAQTQVARLDKLIKRLVELARTEETVRDEQITAFSLSEIAEAGVEAFQSVAQANGKALTADIAEDILLRGIQDDLFRLVTLLLDNAVKYCDAGGTICFSLARRGRNVVLSVSNPCAGLDASQLPRYFDRFYRADSSRARSTGGYGIGLSTAKAIVARHRGRISNRCAGGVITFTAVLPQAG